MRIATLLDPTPRDPEVLRNLGVYRVLLGPGPSPTPGHLAPAGWLAALGC
ncbi:hypothetical protein GCM10022223_23770 [Kineosporia mesophila]|uniref:Uncharacterized protein n=1 Tax=Kineosporia mesophila TaxID=566012 RepID=A0ABP6ZEK2_9ACTN|nr:hypothetical protein [Kineosporia mesophila]MCD5354212.1 hypothetical protein [Kineosporia mesophila]